MRTKDNNIIEDILNLISNINMRKTSEIIDKADKNALFDYINDEFLNVGEYQALLENIKLEKKDILEIIYQILILVNISTKNDNNSMSITEQLIITASNQGFTWPNSNSCFNKVEEEFIELKNAIIKNDENNIKEEIGDLLFTLHCYTNMKKFNYEQIITSANSKFEKRFKKLLEIAESRNIDLINSSSEIKEELWEIAKKSL